MVYSRILKRATGVQTPGSCGSAGLGTPGGEEGGVWEERRGRAVAYDTNEERDRKKKNIFLPALIIILLF